MTQITGPMTITLAAEWRWWALPSLQALAAVCTVVSHVSSRAALWLADVGVAAVARFGMRVVVA